MRLQAVTIAIVATVAGGSFGMSSASRGQTSAGDLERCEALIALYERYLGKKGEGQTGPTLDVKAAIDQCRRGNTAEGIKVLEKTLRANGFKI